MLRNNDFMFGEHGSPITKSIDSNVKYAIL